jgi:hypothetical protein
MPLTLLAHLILRRWQEGPVRAIAMIIGACLGLLVHVLPYWSSTFRHRARFAAAEMTKVSALGVIHSTPGHSGAAARGRGRPHGWCRAPADRGMRSGSWRSWCGWPADQREQQAEV